MTNRYDLNLTFGLKATPERVFRGLTKPDGLESWWAAKAMIDARKGGEFSLHFRNGFFLTGRVISLAKDKSLSFSWVDNSVPKFTLSPVKGGGTLLRLTQKGIEEDGTALNACGWSYYLTNLKSVMDHGVDLRSKEDSF
jgi:uncharacterized protein YndB with AHSA1/START domain